MDVIGIGGTEEDADTYFLNAVLRNNLHVPELEVVEVKTISGADVLIGMNLITMGDFVITSHNGETVFTYQTPSQGEIDFEVGNKNKAIYVGENINDDDPCYCDSGEKYINCHGKQKIKRTNTLT
ncbi:MAG: hypothetical protein IIB39_05885 [Candidatus Marinimicrobia bacterium]|nr:hypothetical protein [Candidatus Neomarinimicrobiota bacterium]